MPLWLESGTRCLQAAGGRTGHPARAASCPRAGLALAASLAATLVLAGCGSTSEGPVAAAVGPPASAPVGFTRERLVGRWGIASYHTEKDRKRTEAQAKAQCSQPYVIAQGPERRRDDACRRRPQALRTAGSRRGPGGKTYLGFEAPAGDPQDREILSATGSMLIMRFVDADAHRRYGTFVYVRCA